VVDDESAIRTLAKTVLERAGYEVTTARDGREAIALLAESDYDVVLLDVTLPNLSGLSVVDELRKNNMAALAHTYLLTAGDSQQFTGLPVRGIIEKPFNIGSLIAEAKDCIGH
jgi:DNA-binding response OmpR family regulator